MASHGVRSGHAQTLPPSRTRHSSIWHRRQRRRVWNRNWTTMLFLASKEQKKTPNSFSKACFSLLAQANASPYFLFSLNLSQLTNVFLEYRATSVRTLSLETVELIASLGTIKRFYFSAFNFIFYCFSMTTQYPEHQRFFPAHQGFFTSIGSPRPTENENRT